MITPPTPAAACACPMLDFTDPIHKGRSTGRPWPYVASRACASIASPSGVPVPCASTTSTSPGASRASRRASRITRCCAGPLGAVNPLLVPSEFTALPRISASTGWPRALASESRSSSSSPTPSDHAVPSARAENALHRPSAASPRCRLNSMNDAGVDMNVTPPATAIAHSPRRSAWPARWTATSEDEQAVSTVMAGPSRPNTYASRPDATLPAAPVIR